MRVGFANVGNVLNKSLSARITAGKNDFLSVWSNNAHFFEYKMGNGWKVPFLPFYQ